MYRILGIWIKPREHAKVGLVPWNIHLLFNLICLRALAPSLNNAVYIYVFSISPLLVMTARNGFRFQFFPKPLSHSVKLNFDWSTIKRSTEKPPLESHHYPSNLNFACCKSCAQVHLGACGHEYKPLVESPDYQ